MRRGGLPDENIVVMMADDIATYPGNPHPHQIFNRPGGEDVYEGVPVVSFASQTVLVLGHCCALKSACIPTALACSMSVTICKAVLYMKLLMVICISMHNLYKQFCKQQCVCRTTEAPM